jgi:hypothetical protein
MILTSLVRLSGTNINAASTGATLVATTENGTERFYPLYAIFIIRANGINGGK